MSFVKSTNARIFYRWDGPEGLPTLVLSIPSLVLAYVLAIPLGLYVSARGGKTDERTISTFLYMLYSFPSFVAALFLQLLFAVKLEWLPLFGIVSDNYESLSTFGKAWDVMLHALLPVTVYTYGSLAYEARFIRSNMQEVLRQDYIRTARAKGLRERAVVMRHTVRNALVPVVTVLGGQMGGLLGGVVIIEQIFLLPGLGRLTLWSIQVRDYPQIQANILTIVVLTLVVNLITDISYGWLDPRIRF